MEDVLKVGRYKLTGIEAYINISEQGTDKEGYYVILNDTVYAFEFDPADGYRSYGNVCIPDDISINDIHNKFPAQLVQVNKITQPEYHDNVTEYYVVSNVKTQEPILKIGTDKMVNNYPVAIFEYHPENMDINKNKKDKYKKHSDALSHYIDQLKKEQIKISNDVKNITKELSAFHFETNCTFPEIKDIEYNYYD